MKTFTASLLALIVLASTVATGAEKKPTKKGDEPKGKCCKNDDGKKQSKQTVTCVCPLFPIMTYSSGTLYFCDYFPTSCNDDPEASYLLGEYLYPWQVCCDDCVAADKSQKSSTFDGLNDEVALGYQHRRGELGDRQFPSPLTRGFSVNRTREETLLTFTIPGTSGHAKLVEFKTPAGGKPRFVAFECHSPINPKPYKIYKVDPKDLIALDGAESSKAYRGSFGDNKQTVLILLETDQ